MQYSIAFLNDTITLSCGRYNLVALPKKIMAQFSLSAIPEYRIDYNINPGSNILAIKANNHSGLFHWGLVPFWAKKKQSPYSLINARVETITENPAFRAAFKERHLVVPSTGLYEWQVKGDKSKQPFHITLPEQQLFGFAALWEHWEKGNEQIDSCTIITTSACSKVAAIHNRMPVILKPENYQAWLDTTLSKEEMLEILKDDSMYRDIQTIPISSFVNNPSNNDPMCIKPL